MKTVSFSAIKGGVGKSSLCILCARYLASSGKKVICVDLDVQNSLSFYFLSDAEISDKKNIFKALSDDNLDANLIPISPYISCIASHFRLLKLRSLQVQTLSHLLAHLDGFDFCLIDTAPTLDNIVLNAVHASDLILSPACLSQFDWKSSLFFRDEIHLELGTLLRWKLLINRYRIPKSHNPDTEINQYLRLFRDEFPDHLLESKIVDATMIQRCIDTGTKITMAKDKERVFTSIAGLCSEIFGIEEHPKEF